MMKFGKLLSIATVVFSMLSIGESSDVCLEFGQNDNTIRCGNEVRSFTNLSDFSSELNNGIAGNLFKSTLVEKNDDVITFYDVSNSEPCRLTLKSANTVRPEVFFNFGNNRAHFLDLIVDNSIAFFSIDCDIPDNVKIDRLQIDSSSTKFSSNNKQINLNNFTIGPNATVRLKDAHISIKRGHE